MPDGRPNPYIDGDGFPRVLVDLPDFRPQPGSGSPNPSTYETDAVIDTGTTESIIRKSVLHSLIGPLPMPRVLKAVRQSGPVTATKYSGIDVRLRLTSPAGYLVCRVKLWAIDDIDTRVDMAIGWDFLSKLVFSCNWWTGSCSLKEPNPLDRPTTPRGLPIDPALGVPTVRVTYCGPETTEQRPTTILDTGNPTSRLSGRFPIRRNPRTGTIAGGMMKIQCTDGRTRVCQEPIEYDPKLVGPSALGSDQLRHLGLCIECNGGEDIVLKDGSRPGVPKRVYTGESNSPIR